MKIAIGSSGTAKLLVEKGTGRVLDPTPWKSIDILSNGAIVTRGNLYAWLVNPQTVRTMGPAWTDIRVDGDMLIGRGMVHVNRSRLSPLNPFEGKFLFRSPESNSVRLIDFATGNPRSKPYDRIYRGRDGRWVAQAGVVKYELDPKTGNQLGHIIDRIDH